MSTNISKEEIDEEIENNWKRIPHDEKLPLMQQMLINYNERIKVLEEELAIIKEYLKLGVKP